LESFGIDECWLDVTGSAGLFGDGKTIADDIRATIRREMGITASAGVSFNKIFAKLGSDMKKPDATTVITPDDYKTKVWCLPASDLLYVGPATTKKLTNYGIATIGQLANADIKHLISWFGKWGVVLSRFANGLDDAPVALKGNESVIKSVGNSSTLPRDVTTVDDAKRVFYMLAESVASRLREYGLKATTVQIYVRDNELMSCERQAGLKYPSCLTSEIAEKSMEIFLKKYPFRKPIRSMGVRACNLVGKSPTVQLDLFNDQLRRERMETMEYTIDDLRRRYGYTIVQRGIVFEDRKLTGINPKDHTIHPINFFDGAISVDLQLKIAV
jgi:DNA polymerase-4